MAARALASTRQSRMHGIVGRTAAVVAVVAITMIGNLRLQASETPHAAASPITTTPVSDRTSRASEAVATAPMLDEDGAGAVDDGVELVPAIYAWDPDVRFVYFRHVSKWM